MAFWYRLSTRWLQPPMCTYHLRQALSSLWLLSYLLSVQAFMKLNISANQLCLQKWQMQEASARQAYSVCLSWYAGQQLFHLLRQAYCLHLAIIPTRQRACPLLRRLKNILKSPAFNLLFTFALESNLLKEERILFRFYNRPWRFWLASGFILFYGLHMKCSP